MKIEKLEIDSKSPLLSKTLWIDILAIIILIIQAKTKFIVSPEIQAAALAIINIILRAITKKPIEWKL